MRLVLCLLLPFSLTAAPLPAPAPALRISVYATAGDVQQHLSNPEARSRTLERLRPLGVSRLWLEGRRGDEYVSPMLLAEIRDFFADRGIECAGGIATVPGQQFGVRQDAELGWLNWESPRTQADVAQFFTDNAPIFPTLIVDDFYCTADTSRLSDQARGQRSWSDYRQSLLVSLIEPMILNPARAARPDVQLILKYPQWYDRFHLFGYDPRRMSSPFDLIWVGTEVRNPATRRMGFVQPTEGYINFRWLTSVAGTKVRGAWFDHIECDAAQFVDQAYQSVMAGASELTLFRLGDITDQHPGDSLLAQRLPDLFNLHRQLQTQSLRGIAFYKPPGTESADNTYLMDYLAMIGLPIVPVADYPAHFTVAIMGAHAAADPRILSRIQRHLESGATIIFTPAFFRALAADQDALQYFIPGFQITPAAIPAYAHNIHSGTDHSTLERPVEVDGGVTATDATILFTASTSQGDVPWLTSRTHNHGRLLLLNLRTFSEQDFRDAGEWLLAPKLLGLPVLPEPLLNRLRREFLSPLAVELEAPPGLHFVLFDHGVCLYNFNDIPAPVRLNRHSAVVPPRNWIWLPLQQ